MKKIIFIALLMVVSMSASTVFAADSKNPTDNPATPAKTENRLTDEQVTRLKNRVEEIRDMDKTNLTANEKLELRKEVKQIKETVKKDGGGIYIGVGTLILIIILIILLV